MTGATAAAGTEQMPLLEVDDLRIAFPGRDGAMLEVVRGVSFTLGRERLGIVGESGSGKSQTGRAILGLTAPEGRVTAKRLAFSGTDLLNCSPRQRRELRGGRMAMVLQDPKFSLNPVMRLGAQIEETLRAHSRVSTGEAKKRTLAALESVRIDDPERVYRLYPHEVSGGMGQRAMIAMMLIAEPDLLIADEPTSALDVTVQLQVLSILDKLVTISTLRWRTACDGCRPIISICTRRTGPTTAPIMTRRWTRSTIWCVRARCEYLAVRTKRATA